MTSFWPVPCGKVRSARLSAILERMIDKRPQADRLLIAQLTGEAGHRAKWRELTEDEEAAAVAALADLAGGRANLLALPQGGSRPGGIPAWIEEGRRRRAAAKMPPFSGGVQPPGLPRRDRTDAGCHSSERSLASSHGGTTAPTQARADSR
jgi:hypothetical protein